MSSADFTIYTPGIVFYASVCMYLQIPQSVKSPGRNRRAANHDIESFLRIVAASSAGESMLNSVPPGLIK